MTHPALVLLLLLFMCLVGISSIHGASSSASPKQKGELAAIFAPYPITGSLVDRTLFHTAAVLTKSMNWKVDLLLPPASTCKIHCIADVYSKLGIDNTTMPTVVDLSPEDPRLKGYDIYAGKYSLILVQGSPQHLIPEYVVKGVGIYAILVSSGHSAMAPSQQGSPLIANFNSYDQVIVSDNAMLSQYFKNIVGQFDELRDNALNSSMGGPSLSIVPNVLSHITSKETQEALAKVDGNNRGYATSGKPFQIAMLGPLTQQLVSIKQALGVFQEVQQQVETRKTSSPKSVRLVILGHHLEHLKKDSILTFYEEINSHIDLYLPGVKRSVLIIAEATQAEITHHLSESNVYWNYMSTARTEIADDFMLQGRVSSPHSPFSALTSKPLKNAQEVKVNIPQTRRNLRNKKTYTKSDYVKHSKSKHVESGKGAQLSILSQLIGQVATKKPAQGVAPAASPQQKQVALAAETPTQTDRISGTTGDTYEPYHMPLAEAMSYGCVPVSFSGFHADYEIDFDPAELDAVRKLDGNHQKNINAVHSNGYLAETSEEFVDFTLQHMLLSSDLQQKLRENAIKSKQHHSLDAFEDTVYNLLMRAVSYNSVTGTPVERIKFPCGFSVHESKRYHMQCYEVKTSAKVDAEQRCAECKEFRWSLSMESAGS